MTDFFQPLNVLVACEESQEVCKSFRLKGHNAFSCDILPCSGGHPEWHIQGDVRKLLLRSDPGVGFYTQDECGFYVNKWDLIIAFPPCTDLCVSGARWFDDKRKSGIQQKSIDFFLFFTKLNCDKVAIENPIGIMSSFYRKPDQIIQPWQFGHGETKATCLWLKGLPLLKPSNIVSGREHRIWMMSPGINRKMERSKTYHGIALAMADQWG